jgi:hypothetical protein
MAASKMTDLNMRVLYKELLRGGGIITRIEQTSQKHLRRTIDAGYIEEFGKNAWQVSALGRQKLVEWLDTPSGKMAKEAFAEKHPDPAPGMARGQKPSGPFTHVVSDFDHVKRVYFSKNFVLPATGKRVEWSSKDVSLEARAVLYMTISQKSLAGMPEVKARDFWPPLGMRRLAHLSQQYLAIAYGVDMLNLFFTNEAGVVLRLAVSGFRGKIGSNERECAIYCKDPGVAETFRDWLLEKLPHSYVDEFYTWPNASPDVDENRETQKVRTSGGRTDTVRRFATFEGISPLQVMNALGASSGYGLDSSRPLETWAPRRLVFFHPSGENPARVDTLWFWPSKTSLFIVSTIDAEMEQEELGAAASPTWEERASVIARNSRKPTRWGVFGKISNAAMFESFFQWLNRRLSPAGGAAGMKKRGMRKHLDDDARDFRAIDKDARDIERRVKALVARDKHVESKKGGRR